MTNDMMFGKTDLEAELREKDEIIMMSKQLERITALEKENEKLKKQINDCKDYNAILYKNCIQKDKRWLKRVKRVEDELEDVIKENARLREVY